MSNVLHELARRYLTKLYELSDRGLQPEVDARTVQSEARLTLEQMGPVVNYLESKDLISWKCRVPCVRITTRGIDEMQNAFSVRERLVLQKLYEARNTHRNGVSPDELALAVNFAVHEVHEFIEELEKQGWVGGSDERAWILPAGIKEVERVPEAPTPTIIINNPTNSPMSFGAHSSQTVTYNNQAVQDILPALSQLIRDVYGLNFENRGDVIAELQKVEILAKGDMNAGKWQLIQSRLLTTKTALEIAQIGAKSLPYWPVVWDFFFK